MGLFSVPEATTKKDYVESAIANLKLYLTHDDLDYLLNFATHQIETVQKWNNSIGIENLHPEDLNQAVDFLLQKLTKLSLTEKDILGREGWLRNESDMHTMPYHSENRTGLGWHIRQHWHLVEDGPNKLSQWFRERGILKPEDMSNLILIALTYENVGSEWNLRPHVERMVEQWKVYGWSQDGKSCSRVHMKPEVYEPMEEGLHKGYWD
jgi:hypothetical protein